jgi:hypothetical protein
LKLLKCQTLLFATCESALIHMAREAMELDVTKGCIYYRACGIINIIKIAIWSI